LPQRVREDRALHLDNAIQLLIGFRFGAQWPIEKAEEKVSTRFLSIIMLVVAVGFFTARAQTTQPAEQPADADLPAASTTFTWNETVQSLATLLTAADADAAAVSSLIPDRSPITRFGSTEMEARVHLRNQTEGLMIVSARGYSWPAAQIATDLAEDVSKCEAMSDRLREQYMPPDDAGGRRANTVAQQWIQSVLDPAPGQMVALIMLWDPPPSPTASLLLGNPTPPEVRQPLLILLKGEKGDDGQHRIVKVAFGDARQALK
jgi:hypothetical protein